MKLKDVLAKVAKGDELTEAEKNYLADYKEPETGDEGGEDSGRIPKSRLDKEIEKRKAAESKSDELATKLEELQGKIEELESVGMSEADKAKKQAEKDMAKLQSQVAALTKERDEAAAKANAMERSGKVRDLATKHNFADSDYLGYKLQSENIDLNDEQAVAGFMKGLEKSAPNLFKSSAKPGTGTASDGAGKPEQSANRKRLDELTGKKELSSREVVEVAELADKVKAEEATAAGNNNNAGGSDGAAAK